MKKLIKNGFIVDGSGNPGYKADVLLNGGIIEKIAETIEEDGAEIINAEGLSLIHIVMTIAKGSLN